MSHINKLFSGKLEETKTLIQSLASYHNLSVNPRLSALLLVGSIPRDNFVPGWSDIDLLAILTEPNIESVSSCQSLQQEVEHAANTKTGVDVVLLPALFLATKNKDYASFFVKHMKNLNDESPLLIKSIIYKNDSVDIPLFPQEIITGINPIPQTQYILNYMINYIKSEGAKPDKRPIIRKIVKNSFFLIQLTLQTHEQVMIDDFEKALELFTDKYPSINVTNLTRAYELRYNWSNLKEMDPTLSSLLTNLWTDFLSLIRNIDPIC